MKRFAAVTLAALMVLTVFASAASAADTVEIRGPVFNGTDLESIVESEEGVYMDANNFAAFFYDLDDGTFTETLEIVNATDDTIDEDSLIYTTTITMVDFEYGPGFEDADEYPILGFFAEEFVPIDPAKADKLAKLVMDDDEKYTLRTGEILDLGEGYALEAKQVDVDGEKVWLEFTKDGEFIDDEIISVATTEDTGDWIVDLDDIEDEDDVIVMRMHVNQVFQGAVDSIAQIEGIWLIDFESAFTIESDDEYGELEVTVDGDSLELKNPDEITLNIDDTEDIAEGMAFLIADDDEELRFYVFKEYTEPGTYEIRGTVITSEAEGDTFSYTWDESSFAGFYYDIDDNVATETLSIVGSANDDTVEIEDGDLDYTTSIQSVAFEYAPGFEDAEDYPVLGFFAEKYVPIDAAKADKLAKLVLDDDEKYTLRTGEILDLGEGYALEAKQVDVDGEKVWLEFTKDGEFIDDEIISVVSGETGDWIVDLDDIEDEDDVVVMRMHVNQVFQGAVDSIAQIEGIWLIDFENAFTIESDDTYGELEVTVDGATLRLENDDSITLNKDDEQDIAEGMYFKMADNTEDFVRFYPAVEVTIEGEEEEPAETPAEEEPTEEVTETPAEEEPTEEVTETPVEEEPTEEEPTEEETEEEPTPGFGIVLGLAGLLAVVYLIRRN